jgi:hypothetical protein
MAWSGAILQAKMTGNVIKNLDKIMDQNITSRNQYKKELK